MYRYVVAAVLERAGAVLLLQRPPGDFMGGIFELPSGKVEPTETLATALRREVKEETGLTLAAIDRYLGHFDYVSGSGRPTRQFTFAATAETLQPITLSEHMRYAWVRPDESAQLTVSDSVRAVLAEYWRRPEL